MCSRRLILGLIILTLLAFGLLGAAKLRATPKYDRIQVGMTRSEVSAILGPSNGGISDEGWIDADYECDEGTIVIAFRPTDDSDITSEMVLMRKAIDRRGPLERLAWLAGWR